MQATQKSDGIPAIDEPSIILSVPQGQQEVTQKTTIKVKYTHQDRHDCHSIDWQRAFMQVPVPAVAGNR